MTYDELVTNIRNYTEVDSNVFSNSGNRHVYFDWRKTAFMRDIDLDVFKIEATANMTSGNRFLVAPSDILTHRYIMATLSGDQTFLEFRDTSFMKEYWPDSTVTGTPKYYSVWNQNTFISPLHQTLTTKFS